NMGVKGSGILRGNRYRSSNCIAGIARSYLGLSTLSASVKPPAVFVRLDRRVERTAGRQPARVTHRQPAFSHFLRRGVKLMSHLARARDRSTRPPRGVRPQSASRKWHLMNGRPTSRRRTGLMRRSILNRTGLLLAVLALLG